MPPSSFQSCLFYWKAHFAHCVGGDYSREYPMSESHQSLRIKELSFPTIDQTGSLITILWLFKHRWGWGGENIIMQIILVDSN